MRTHSSLFTLMQPFNSVRQTLLTADYNQLDTRYFMIKSWNTDNVEIALRDVSDPPS